MKFHLIAAAAISALLLGTSVHAQTAAPAATTAPAPAARTATPAPRPAASTANQFKTEAEAKAHCPSDTVVWANKDTKVFHVTGSRYYGKTKVGAYMCQKDAVAAQFRAARTRSTTRPAATPAATSAPAAPAATTTTTPAATPAAPR